MENYHSIIHIITFFAIALLAIGLYRKNEEAKRLEGQLTKFKGQSDEELYSRGKFSELGLMSAGITHEISNPLSIILGRITQLLRMDLVPEKKPDLDKGLNQIKTNAERIAAIIHSVREYIYRNDDRSEDFISLDDILKNVLVFYGQRLKNHGIDLRMKNIEGVYVSGHKGQLEQAFLNMISNSFDAIDNLKEKWIEISVEKNVDVVKIFITDSGSGIPKDVQDKMLDPFFTTKSNKGSGLGLSLVKGIAQKHGGDLTYVPGEHTTFKLELPQANSLQYHH